MVPANRPTPRRGGSSIRHARRRAGVVLFALALFVALLPAPRVHAQVPVTPIQALHLEPDSSSRAHAPVAVSAVTTFVDPSRAFAYVQDASGAIRVAFAPGSAVPEVGDRVR